MDNLGIVDIIYHFDPNKDYLLAFLSWADLNPYQTMVDICLVFFAMYILIQRPIKPERPLSKREIDESCEEWESEPLFPPLTDQMKLDLKLPLITGTNSTHVTIDNKSVLNLSRFNFLGFVCNRDIEDAAIKTVQTYGVGTCGPRQFYGTIDVHLTLEQRISKFLGTQDCLIYSYGMATSSSVIPAFAGRGDILVVDKGISISLQIGVNLSRSDIYWYNHNDMSDMERVLQEIERKMKREKRPVTRRFIVFEGVSLNFGDIAPLPTMIALKNKYKYRMIMEDMGIGTIGKTGRGTCEYHNVSVSEIEMLCGNLEHMVGSVGGFCAARKNVVYHQRLNSTGYVYSASLPPLLAAHSVTALDMIDSDPELLQNFRKKFEIMYQGLKGITGLVVNSDPNSPIIHVELAQTTKTRYQSELILQTIVDESLTNGVLLTRCKYSTDENYIPRPSIRVCVCLLNTKEQLVKALEVIKKATVVAASGIKTSILDKDTAMKRSISTNAI